MTCFIIKQKVQFKGKVRWITGLYEDKPHTLTRIHTGWVRENEWKKQQIRMEFKTENEVEGPTKQKGRN